MNASTDCLNRKLLDDVAPAAGFIRQQLAGFQPETAVVIGSGFSGLLSSLNLLQSFSYTDLPGFPAPGVAGHSGCLLLGYLFERPVVVFAGRYHVYEGYSAWQVTAQVRLAAALGCRKLLLTNAAGGMLPAMRAGDFMLVSDHINMTGLNPLVGRHEAGFPDLHDLYQVAVYDSLARQLQSSSVVLHSGVLAWMTGPSYETPAEINMLRLLGAGAVSMSTVPEAIMARFLDLDLCAVSFISNLAAGICPEPLNHADVLAAARQAVKRSTLLVDTLFTLW